MNKEKQKAQPTKAGPKQVTWPKEYAEFATHTTQTAVAKTLKFGNAKTKLNRAVVLLTSVVQPTDKDDEFGDGAQNAYKIVKSLTSGARFWRESTLYTYRTVYRYLVVILARAFGLLQASKQRMNVSNGPNIAAYQMFRGGGITEQYNDAVKNIPAYEKILLEMVSELNSMPVPTIGGMDKMFEYFAHIYKDDKALASDYYAFIPTQAADFTYDDDQHELTAISQIALANKSIPDLNDDFSDLVNKLRDSVDINNLMSDVLNALPSSKYDWMNMLKKHEDFVRDVTPEMLTKIGSATMPMAIPTGIGTLDATSQRIQFKKSDMGTSPNDFHNAALDEVGQMVSTYRGAGEHNCYELMLHDVNATAGYTPAATDLIATSGVYISVARLITDFGTAKTSPTLMDLAGCYNNSNSTTQTTAEQGGKDLMMAYMNFGAMPKIDLYNYGASGGDDNLLWRFEDLKEAAAEDVCNNIKALNMLAASTVHLTTEKPR